MSSKSKTSLGSDFLPAGGGGVGVLMVVGYYAVPYSLLYPSEHNFPAPLQMLRRINVSKPHITRGKPCKNKIKKSAFNI